MRSPEFLMTYYNQLSPWCIIRCLPNAQTLIVARLRRRNDAEAHLRILQQITPTATYHIIFDVADNLLREGRSP
jgi:hypothetical protein